MEAALSTGGHLDSLGYQAALEAGMATADLGASDAALPYFRRAAEVRPTAIALSHIGRCLRDLGQLDEAERAYRDALDAVGGDSGHALVGLIAVLCDQRRYETALLMAERAALEYRDSAPAQTVAARCFDQFAASLAATGGASNAHLEPVRRAAAEMRRRARQLEPHEPAQALRRRRERPFPLPAVYAQTLIATNAARPDGAPGGEGDVVRACADPVVEGSPEEKTVGIWRRLLRSLTGRS